MNQNKEMNHLMIEFDLLWNIDDFIDQDLPFFTKETDDDGTRKNGMILGEYILHLKALYANGLESKIDVTELMIDTYEKYPVMFLTGLFSTKKSLLLHKTGMNYEVANRCSSIGK